MFTFVSGPQVNQLEMIVRELEDHMRQQNWDKTANSYSSQPDNVPKQVSFRISLNTHLHTRTHHMTSRSCLLYFQSISIHTFPYQNTRTHNRTPSSCLLYL
jgi:hypothetical protein